MEKNLVNKYIAEAIREVIKERGEKYRDVSQKLDMSYGYFRQLMAGNKGFLFSKVYAIARIEQIPIDKLCPPIKDNRQSFNKYEAVTGDKSKVDFEKFLKKTKIR